MRHRLSPRLEALEGRISLSAVSSDPTVPAPPPNPPQTPTPDPEPSPGDFPGDDVTPPPTPEGGPVGPANKNPKDGGK